MAQRYELRTFKDIVDSVMEELKIQTSDTVERNRIKRNINSIYIDEVVPASQWKWLRDSITLQQQAYYGTGTAVVTSNSATVTLSGTIAASKAGHYFSANGYSEIYRIQAHTAGTAVLTLETPFTGQTSSVAAYKIWTDAIPLPTDCKETLEITHQFRNRPLENTGFQEFRRISAGNPKAENRPQYYTTGDWVDPGPFSSVSGLPTLSTRASAGLVRIFKFSASLGTGESNLLLKVGDKIRISGCSELNYNGEYSVGGISTTTLENDTITFTGRTVLQESSTSDTAPSIQLANVEAASERYRELYIYPSLYNSKTTLHIDYIRDAAFLEADTDEPLMPIEDRIILLYGALSLSWSRMRNPEEAARNKALFDMKLSRMQGKLDDSTDRFTVVPNKSYLATKRSTSRSRYFTGRGDTFGGSSGGSSSSPSGTANTAAIFNSSGDLVASPTVSTTELGYLDGVTSAIQTQLDGKVSTTLPSGQIIVGNASNVATAVDMTGDMSISNAGVAAINSGVIVNDDVSASAAIARTKLASGTADHVIINNGTGVMSSEAALAKVRGGTGADNSSVTFPSSGVIVTEAATQTLTGKTIDGDDNTIQDLALSSLKTVLADASKFLVRDASGIVVSNTKDVPAGVIVGTSDSQTLTNKVIERIRTNVAVDSSSTGANVDLSTPSATLVILTNVSLTSIRSIVSPTATQLLVLKNDTGAEITVANQAGAATAADRIITGSGNDLRLKDDAAVFLVYDTNASRWQVVGGSGAGGALEVSGSRASPTAITAGGGITSTANQRQIIFIEGSGGHVDVSVNPQISAGTIVGQELVLIGRNNSQTVTLENGTGLELNGVAALGAGSILQLIWDGTVWTEASRNF